MSQQPYSARYTLRDLSANVDATKDRYGACRPQAATNCSHQSSASSAADLIVGRRSGSFSARGSRSPSASSRGSSTYGEPTAKANMVPRHSSSHVVSPHADRRTMHNPAAVTDFTQEITDMYLAREKTLSRDPNYMAGQSEINEKMRTILVDWLVDVHMKFKLHEETFFLAVDLIDRYLSVARVARSQLQLVGVTCVLLAAKYEEIWPPEVKDCVHISANTYSRDEILKMERSICAALSFKLTTPTPFPMLARLLEVTDADSTTRHLAWYFLENAVLDYKHLQFLPSQLANAALYLANVTQHKPDPWNFTLQYYAKASLDDFRRCARALLDFTTLTSNSKYQAIRRKYTSSKFNEVARMALPTDV